MFLGTHWSFWLFIVTALFVLFMLRRGQRVRRPAPIPDGTKCGDVWAHRWKYVHEQCMGRKDLVCRKCGITGMFESGNDEHLFYMWFPKEGTEHERTLRSEMRLHVMLNDEVHYDDDKGTCRICRLPAEVT